MWWKKTLFVLLCCLPAGYFLYVVTSQQLTDPVDYLVVQLGHTAAIGFMLVFAWPLLKRFWQPSQRFRRQLGIMVFIYAALHMLSYLGLENAWDWRFVLSEVGEKPYLIVGLICLVVLLALAVTSNNFSVRRLGKRWKSLHKMIYPLGFLLVVHIYMAAKVDWADSLYYLSALLLALALKSGLPKRLRSRASA